MFYNQSPHQEPSEVSIILIMKKIIVVLASILLSLVMFGQEHLGFKNIPIDGTTSQFIAKLKAVGYTVVGEYSDDIRFCNGYLLCSNGRGNSTKKSR